MLTSVQNVARVLKSFTLDRPELGLAELVTILGIPKSTLFKTVCTLVEQGFLEKNQETNKYRLHNKLSVMSKIVLANMELVKMTNPYLQMLAKRCSEAIHLSCYENGEIVWVSKLESRYPLKMYSRVGRHAPVYATAPGKAMLAFMDSIEFNRVIGNGFRKITSQTITEDARLYDELKQVKLFGYSLQNEELIDGVASVGAPIFDSTGRPVAAVSIAGSAQRFNRSNIEMFGQMVRQCAKSISEAIG